MGAKGFNSYAFGGAPRAKTVVLNRRVPYKVLNFSGGRNGTSVEFEWSPNRERDIEGYQVYRQTSSSPQLVCTLTQQTQCRDTNPPQGVDVNYFARALDRDSSNALRLGDASDVALVRATNTAPYPPACTHDDPPVCLSASFQSNGIAKLTWLASPGDPDTGDTIDHYNIYRDGQTYADRYDRTAATGSTLTYTDTKTGGSIHTYWVTAVDSQHAESPMVGAVGQ